MKQETIREILKKYYEASNFDDGDFPCEIEGVLFSFVEKQLSNDEDYWIIVAAESEGEKTFWKIPGYRYHYGEDVELEPWNAFQVVQGVEVEVEVYADTEEKLSDEILYPVIGYFWLKLGNNQHKMSQAYSSEQIFNFLDFSLQVVDIREVGYDEGEDGHATLKIEKDGSQTFISVGTSYDSTEGFSLSPHCIHKAKKETKIIHQWDNV